jgi:hypothetical protein
VSGAGVQAGVLSGGVGQAQWDWGCAMRAGAGSGVHAEMRWARSYVIRAEGWLVDLYYVAGDTMVPGREHATRMGRIEARRTLGQLRDRVAGLGLNLELRILLVTGGVR